MVRVPTVGQGHWRDLCIRYSSTACGTTVGGHTCKPLIQEQAIPSGSYLVHHFPPPAPQRERWREKPPRLTGLSHPGYGETGEAEEQDRNQRDQQVHALGPHGGGQWGSEQRGGWRLREGRGPAPPRRSTPAPAHLPPLQGSLGPTRTGPALGQLPRPPVNGSALRIRTAWWGCWWLNAFHYGGAPHCPTRSQVSVTYFMFL